MPQRRTLLAALLTLPGAAAAQTNAPPATPPAVPPVGAAAAGGFPSRPIRLVVPFAAGGAVDLTGRFLAEQLQPILGQPVVVENRGGAGGNLGADAVAKAERDGHTLLLGSASILAANKFLYRRSMPLDPVRDLAPVTRVTTGTVALVVRADRPWKTVAELIEAARRAPGTLTMGSSGTGTVSHLALETFNRAAGIRITHVPYRGGGPALQDLLSGTVDLMFDVTPILIPPLGDGRLRALVMGSAEPVGFVPELAGVPGMEAALPGSGMDIQGWYAVNAPMGTLDDRIAVLHRALVQVVRGEAFAARMRPLGFTPQADDTPAGYGAYMRAQEREWQRLVEASGATLE